MTNKLSVYEQGHFGAGGFKGWLKGHCGDKPGDDLFNTVHGLGLRPGKQALAVAMAMRPQGVTGHQIIMACGAPQLNRMRGLINAGVVKRDGTAGSDTGHTVYKLTLTKKGQQVIDRHAAQQAKLTADGGGDATSKPKRKAKATGTKRPRKAKGAAASEAAPQGDTPQAPQVTGEAPATSEVAPQGDAT